MKRTAQTDKATGYAASPSSVRLAVTLSRALWNSIDAEARRNSRSLSGQIVNYATRGIRSDRALRKGRVSR
jgi:hypothetical protein